MIIIFFFKKYIKLGAMRMPERVGIYSFILGDRNLKVQAMYCSQELCKLNSHSGWSCLYVSLCTNALEKSMY